MVDAPEERRDPSFGEDLRKEREIRGISLREIADSTKISKRFLEAIERTDLATLPGAVFTRGFVREYARYLGLDADEMVNRYLQFAAAQEVAAAEAQLEKDRQPRKPAVAVPVRPRRRMPKRRRSGPAVLVAVVGIAAIGLVAWYFAGRRTHAVTRSVQPVVETAVAPVVAAPRPAAAPPASVPAPAEGLSMNIKANQSTWLEIEGDGQKLFGGSLAAGEEKSFSAREKFNFRTIGNAGGVTITLNGRTLPPLGPSGQVLHDRVFDRATLQEAEQPHP